jgi:hypothetical protein
MRPQPVHSTTAHDEQYDTDGNKQADQKRRALYIASFDIASLAVVHLPFLSTCLLPPSLGTSQDVPHLRLDGFPTALLEVAPRHAEAGEQVPRLRTDPVAIALRCGASERTKVGVILNQGEQDKCPEDFEGEGRAVGTLARPLVLIASCAIRLYGRPSSLCHAPGRLFRRRGTLVAPAYAAHRAPVPNCPGVCRSRRRRPPCPSRA